MIPKVIKKAEVKPTNEVVVLKPPKNLSEIRKASISLRTKRAINLVVKGGTKADALRKAGFSKSVVKSPGKVFDRPAVKNLIDPVIKALEKERDEIIKGMGKKRSSANYATLSMALRNVNHDLQLLSGKATERVDIPISEEEKERLLKLVTKNT